MDCLKCALLIFLFLLVFSAILTSCESDASGMVASGMVARRQIRDDPNHTRYASSVDGIIPVLEYGDQQF